LYYGELTLEDKSGVSILIALFPDGDNLINGDVADIIVVVAKLKDFAIDLHDLSAKAGSAGAHHVDFFVDQFGK
jgi:hypothetical protein